jgi:non-haem Fe2+, alpha-ketoglutarate-dependent halogenase
MGRLNAELPNLLGLLQPGETAKDIREWHETSTYLYEIIMNPKIHNLVEGILGPNFYCWASSFFIKEPFSKSTNQLSDGIRMPITGRCAHITV